MTGAELLTYIKETFKRTDKNSELYEAITDTIMDMKIKFTPETFKVISYTSGIDTLGEYYYELPANFGYLIGRIKILDGNDSYPLDKISKTTYDQYQANPAFTGVNTSKPQAFCIYGNQVYLYPVPDSLDYQYEMNYTEEDATVVAADTADVDFSDRYRECLKYGVLARMYIDLQDDQEAMKYNQLYENALGLIIAREDKNLEVVTNVTYHDL